MGRVRKDIATEYKAGNSEILLRQSKETNRRWSLIWSICVQASEKYIWLCLWFLNIPLTVCPRKRMGNKINFSFVKLHSWFPHKNINSLNSVQFQTICCLCRSVYIDLASKDKFAFSFSISQVRY